MQLGIQTVGGGAAQKIHFVRAGGRDEKIRILDTGLEQHIHRRTVAVNGHYIHALHAGIEDLTVGIDQRDVISFGRKLPGQGRAYLAVTCDDYVHSVLRLQ